MGNTGSDREKIAAAFDGLVAAAGTDARRLAGLARIAQSSGRGELAYPLARQARALAPGNPEIASSTQAAYAGAVPRWHLNMLRDERRSALYQAAIERAVQPGDRVLDIGSGSGLLAMMAARAGAARVYTCEMNPAVADVATEIVAHNGFADRITVIGCKSTKIDAERDLGGRVDMLVSEILGGSLIDEGILPVTQDAVSRLLRPGGRIIPQSGEIVVALAEVPRVERRLVSEVAGFDVSAFNRLAKSPIDISMNAKEVFERSEPADLYAFDFTRGGNWGPLRASLDLVSAGGRVNGVLLWMRFRPDSEAEYEARVGSATGSSWVALFFPIERPVDIPAGRIVRVDALRTDYQPFVWVDESQLTDL